MIKFSPFTERQTNSWRTEGFLRGYHRISLFDFSLSYFQDSLENMTKLILLIYWFPSYCSLAQEFPGVFIYMKSSSSLAWYFTILLYNKALPPFYGLVPAFLHNLHILLHPCFIVSWTVHAYLLLQNFFILYPPGTRLFASPLLVHLLEFYLPLFIFFFLPIYIFLVFCNICYLNPRCS